MGERGKPVSDAQRRALAYLSAGGSAGRSVLMMQHEQHRPSTMLALFGRRLIVGDNKDFRKCWRLYLSESGERVVAALPSL